MEWSRWSNDALEDTHERINISRLHCHKTASAPTMNFLEAVLNVGYPKHRK